ncbi:MAG: hypothetical protein Q7U82_12495 [Gammaproteobacteria bacterium]|nr:hypothetical protein [Gammaproteobacteria bacterium]
MTAATRLLLTVLFLSTPTLPLHAQDAAAVLRTPITPNTVHPAVALEQRIIGHIDALGITGEQEPPFRVAMQQVVELEAEVGSSITTEVLLNRIVVIVAKVLYPTQVDGFRERELERMMGMRGR